MLAASDTTTDRIEKRPSRLKLRIRLKWLMLLFTIAAAFLAGRMSVIRRAQEAELRQREIEQQLFVLLGHQLYTDEYAKEVEGRVIQITGGDGYLKKMLTRKDLLKALQLNGERLPAWTDYPMEVRPISPNYWLHFGPYNKNTRLITYVRMSKDRETIPWQMP